MKGKKIVKIEIISRDLSNKTCLCQIWWGEKYAEVKKITFKELKELCELHGVKPNE